MAYQRRKRRFDRKKVVLVERTICILILLALLALAGRWIAGQLSKEDSQKKKQTKTQTDNTAQRKIKLKRKIRRLRSMISYAVTAPYQQNFSRHSLIVQKKIKSTKDSCRFPQLSGEYAGASGKKCRDNRFRGRLSGEER